MAFTISRYLKLKIADDLSSDAKYNLEKIDALGAIFARDTESDTNIRSSQNIAILPEDPSIGGGGNDSGRITLGDINNKATVVVNSVEFQLRSALSLLNTATNATNYLSVSFLNAADLATPQSLSIGVGTGNRSISFPEDGEVVTTTGVQTLVDKTITGIFTGPLTGNVTGDVSGTASNVTGIVAVANGGTGAGSAPAAIANLLPSYAGNEDKILALNSAGTALEWKAAGAGQVVSIQSVSPIYVDTGINPGDSGSTANPIISLPAASSSSDGYLSTTDWNIFNGKEPAITPSGNGSQYWNGNKVFAAIPKADVGLGNVDNTSDIDKPISSATQTALNAKYDSSNPASYVDAAGARTAAVVNSTAGSETDQAASVAAMKAYVGSYSGGSYAADWTTNTSITLTHGLNSEDITVNIYDKDTKREILVDEINRGDATLPTPLDTTTKVTLTASVAPTGSGWRVVVRK